MQTIATQNPREVILARKKFNQHNHDLALLEEEKGVLPVEVYLQRKQDLHRQINLMQATLNDNKPAKTALIY